MSVRSSIGPRHAVARTSHRARPGHSLRRRRGEQLCREHAGARIGAGDEPDDPTR